MSILGEGEAGLPVAEVCRKHGISTPTYYVVGTEESRKANADAVFVTGGAWMICKKSVC